MFSLFLALYGDTVQNNKKKKKRKSFPKTRKNVNYLNGKHVKARKQWRMKELQGEITEKIEEEMKIAMMKTPAREQIKRRFFSLPCAHTHLYKNPKSQVIVYGEFFWALISSFSPCTLLKKIKEFF